MTMRGVYGEYLPSQSVIRRVCAEIRESWPESEYDRRASHWRPVELGAVPIVRVSDFRAAVASEVEDESDP